MNCIGSMETSSLISMILMVNLRLSIMLSRAIRMKRIELLHIARILEKLWELVGSLLTTHTTSLHLTRSLMDLTIPLRREGILIMQLIMVLPPLRSKVSSMIMMTNSVV